MSFMGWLDWFIPKETKFFAMLRKQSINAVAVAESFESLIKEYNKLEAKERKDRIRHIKDLEHEGDMLIESVIESLNSTFITPIDREDIHQLARELDDVVDQIDAIAARLDMFALEKSDKGMIDLAVLITDGVKELDILTEGISKQHAGIKIHFNRIKEIEHEADEIRSCEVKKLFKMKINPVRLLKQKEIYEMLENTTDRVDDASNMIEGIVVKHA